MFFKIITLKKIIFTFLLLISFNCFGLSKKLIVQDSTLYYPDPITGMHYLPENERKILKEFVYNGMNWKWGDPNLPIASQPYNGFPTYQFYLGEIGFYPDSLEYFDSDGYLSDVNIQYQIITTESGKPKSADKYIRNTFLSLDGIKTKEITKLSKYWKYNYKGFTEDGKRYLQTDSLGKPIEDYLMSVTNLKNDKKHGLEIVGYTDSSDNYILSERNYYSNGQLVRKEEYNLPYIRKGLHVLSRRNTKKYSTDYQDPKYNPIRSLTKWKPLDDLNHPLAKGFSYVIEDNKTDYFEYNYVHKNDSLGSGARINYYSGGSNPLKNSRPFGVNPLNKDYLLISESHTKHKGFLKDGVETQKSLISKIEEFNRRVFALTSGAASNGVAYTRYSVSDKAYIAGYNPKKLDFYDIKSLINVFLKDCENHNIEINKTQNITGTFESLENNAIALAYGYNDDSKIIIKIDPEMWLKSSLPTKFYILYHELGHDVLNLMHGQGGKMMFNFTEEEYSWKDFFIDRDNMFKKYKSDY